MKETGLDAANRAQEAPLPSCAFRPLSDHPSVLKSIYLEKRANLVRFFSIRLGSADAAEDLVQDIFVKISALPESKIENPVAYLYRVGWNIMLDKLRHQRRAKARDEDWSDTQHTVLVNDAVTEAPSAEDVLEGRQRLQRIVDALKDLPPQTRRVFRMHKFEGLSHGEVAAALGISRSAVEKHVSAALRRLLMVRS